MTRHKEERKQSVGGVLEVIQMELADKDFKVNRINMFKNFKGKNRHKE